MIVRKKRTSGYGAVPNAPFERDDLTWEAKGLLTYLLLKPDNWRVDPQDIAKRGKTARSKPGAGTGRDKVYALLKELVEARYVQRVYVRDHRGVVQSVEYHAYDEPYEPNAPSASTPKADPAKAEVEPLPPKADLPNPDPAEADPAKAHLRINTNPSPSTENQQVLNVNTPDEARQTGRSDAAPERQAPGADDTTQRKSPSRLKWAPFFEHVGAALGVNPYKAGGQPLAFAAQAAGQFGEAVGHDVQAAIDLFDAFEEWASRTKFGSGVRWDFVDSESLKKHAGKFIASRRAGAGVTATGEKRWLTN